MPKVDSETERRVIELYTDEEQKTSIRKAAQIAGISPDTAWRILIKNNVSRRSVSEAKMKYPKSDFSGDLAGKARICGFIHDCWVGYHYRQILVKSSTTHFPQIKLVDDLFGRDGHVGRRPDYNRQFSTYQWQQQILLNNSFEFLIKYRKNPLAFLDAIEGTGCEYCHIAGLADAESWIGIHVNNGFPQAILQIGNKDRQLLEWVQSTLGGRIYPDKRYKFQLRLFKENAVEALRRLPIAHQEKVAAKELISRHHDNGGIGLAALWEYKALRRKIDDDVRLCTLEARLEWIRRHGKPHRNDPDQTIPPGLPLSPSFSFLFFLFLRGLLYFGYFCTIQNAIDDCLYRRSPYPALGTEN